MRSDSRNSGMIRVYQAVLALCICALAFGIWNGLQRGHWQFIGLTAVLVTSANLALLLKKELGRSQP